MRVVADARPFTVVFPDGTSVNPGYRVARNPSYPGIGDDYRHTFATLAGLRPDIWLAPHTVDFGFAAKLARADTDGAAAWVDPAGYQRFIAERQQRFAAEVAKEDAVERGGG